MASAFLLHLVCHPHHTQGLMRTEGAVLRQLAPPAGGGSSGPEANSPWRVLLKDGRSDNFIQVS